MSVNKVILIGNLGRDPELRYSPGGDAIANFSIACTEKYKDKAGQAVEHTEWVNITIFGKLAEIAGEYLKKGAPVYIEGKMRTEKYTDKSGIEKYSTKVICQNFQMLGSKAERSESPRQSAATVNDARKYAAATGGEGLADMDDDIPF